MAFNMRAGGPRRPRRWPFISAEVDFVMRGFHSFFGTSCGIINQVILEIRRASSLLEKYSLEIIGRDTSMRKKYGLIDQWLRLRKGGWFFAEHWSGSVGLAGLPFRNKQQNKRDGRLTISTSHHVTLVHSFVSYPVKHSDSKHNRFFSI